MATEKQVYRLASSGLVYAPGFIAWAQNGAQFKRDRANLVGIVRDTWAIPEAAARALVVDRTTHVVEGEGNNAVVVFEA